MPTIGQWCLRSSSQSLVRLVALLALSPGYTGISEGSEAPVPSALDKAFFSVIDVLIERFFRQSRKIYKEARGFALVRR